MYRQQVLLITNLLLLADGLVFILGGYLAWYIYWELTWQTFAMSDLVFLLMALLLILLNAFILGNMRLYDENFLPPLKQCLVKIFTAVVLEFSLIYTSFLLIEVYELQRDFMLIYAGLSFTGLMLSRILGKAVLRMRIKDGRNLTRILLVGDAERLGVVNVALDEQGSWGHRVIGWLHYGPEEQEIPGLQKLGDYSKLEELLHNEALDEVIIALPAKADLPLDSVVERCRLSGITVRIIPSMFNPKERVRGLTVEHLKNVPTLTVYGMHISPTGLFYKRILDIVGGLVGFVFFLILLPFVALAIKRDSPGPVLFRQTRVGLNNRHFQLYKFRSMYIDAEERKKELLKHNEMEGLMFKMADDPRITKVGKFLRRTSLDEFPQFINVLKGDMSLVGTRPPTPDEVEHYEPWQRRRISMKPGVTGLWQISGRSSVKSFQDVVKYDLEYIDQWRFRRDLVILFKTVMVVATGRGAS